MLFGLTTRLLTVADMRLRSFHLRNYRLTAFVLLIVAIGDHTPAETHSDRAIRVQSLSVSPSTIRVGAANRRQLVVVTATDLDGQLFDVTGRCELSIEDDRVAAISSESIIRPVADGVTQLRVRYGSKEVRVAIRVADHESYPLVPFENDVVPVLSKLGCNSGSCHGKQSGKNGFKLSVFGFDPQVDHNALTKEARGRRIFSSDPGRSLLVMKATGRSAHGGGRRTEVNSVEARLLTEWIRQGTPMDNTDQSSLNCLGPHHA